MKLKKLLAGLLIVILICLPFTGCKKSDKTKIRLYEVTHSIFYAPLYVAINNGYFEEYGIDLQISNGGGAQNVMNALTSKSADIGLMGPEATVYVHVGGQKDYPVIFGQLTKCDGSFLMSKKAEPNFKWTDTAGKYILAGRKGGMPAMALQYVMNQAGVDTSTDLFDTKVAFDMVIPTFEESNKYDYCTMFEPTASEFVAAGKGHIVASVGKSSGLVPYTAFSAKKSYISENKELVTNFLRAVIKGYKFVIESKPDEIAKALKGSFTDFSDASIIASVNSYIEIDAWNQTPIMTKESFDRLQDIMENAGELSTTRADYNVAVDNTIAKIVEAEILGK